MKRRVSNCISALLVVGFVFIPPAWGEMYEWCDPATGALRLGDRPPSGVAQYWIDGERPAPVLRDGKPQPLCAPTSSAPAASPAPPAPSEVSTKAVSQSTDGEVQKRNAAVIENLVRQTPHYQDGSLAGSNEPEYGFNRGVLVLHRGVRDPPSDPDWKDKPVHVRGYSRQDGTYVAPYQRSLPSR